MTINKYFFTTTLTYLAIFFSPLLGQVFQLNPQQLILLTTGAYLLGAALLIFYSTQLKETPVVEGRLNSQTKIGSIIGWGVAGIFIAFAAQILAVQLESLLFGITAGSENTQSIVSIVKSFPLYIAAVSVGGPIMEELVFRRAIISFLTKKIPPLMAALISSLLFALAHNDGHIILYMTIGLVFYFLYQKTGSIWTSIIAHCSMNLLVVLAQTLLL